MTIYHKDPRCESMKPFKINQLYMSKPAAEHRLLEAKRERIKVLQAEIGVVE